MVSSWVLSRFRSAWLSRNLALLVLGLLRESALSEWEVLARLHSLYGLDPSAREFGRLKKELVGEGYATLEKGLGNRLQITTAGLKLLRRLEEEHRALATDIGRARGSRTGAAGV